MIENLDDRADKIMYALDGLSTFEAVGLLVSIITFITAKDNAKT